jgi:hypothetical protein
MSTQDDAFFAEAKSLNYTFRAKAGTKPTWTPRWGFVTDEPRFDPRFKIGGQFGGWFYGVRAYGGHGQDVGEPEAKRGPDVNEYYSDHAGVLGTGVYVTGVAGTSIHQPGVYGQLGEEDPLSPFPRFGENALLAGVVGVSSYHTGVRGWSNRYGVWGESIEFAGVRGQSRNDVGVEAWANAWGSPAVLAIRKRAPASSAMRALLGR